MEINQKQDLKIYKNQIFRLKNKYKKNNGISFKIKFQNNLKKLTQE